MTRYIAKYRASLDDSTSLWPNFKVSQVFTEGKKNMLKNYIIKKSKLNHGLFQKQIWQLANDFAGVSPDFSDRVLFLWNCEKPIHCEFQFGAKFKFLRTC